MMSLLDQRPPERLMIISALFGAPVGELQEALWMIGSGVQSTMALPLASFHKNK